MINDEVFVIVVAFAIVGAGLPFALEYLLPGSFDLTGVSDAPEVTPPHTGAHAAVVYIDGDTVYAVSGAGRVIENGSAGEDDCRVIQAAIDAVESGAILIRAGNYTLDNHTAPLPKRGNICIDRSDLRLMGEGQDATILRLDATKGDEYAIVINGEDAWLEMAGRQEEVSPQTNVTISDLAIEGRGILDPDAWSYGGIWLWGARECRVDNVTVRGVCEGIFSHMGEANTISNCTLKAIKDNALDLTQTHHSRYENILVDNSELGIPRLQYGNGIQIGLSKECNYNSFTNITINGCLFSIYVKYSSNNRFSNISITDSQRDPVHLTLNSSSNAFDGVAIAGTKTAFNPGAGLLPNENPESGNKFLNVTVHETPPSPLLSFRPTNSLCDRHNFLRYVQG